MKRVRSVINIILGSVIAALGLNSCEQYVKYGAPIAMYGCPVDTTVHCMYGVNPNPSINWDDNSQEEDTQY